MYINYNDKVKLLWLDEYDKKRHPNLKLGMIGKRIREDGEIFPNVLLIQFGDEVCTLLLEQVEKVD